MFWEDRYTKCFLLTRGNGMKKFKGYIVSTILISCTLLLGGCGSKSEKWAYAYEPTKEVIELSDNGKAQYKGNNYTYTQDDNFIELKDKSGIKIVCNGDSMRLSVNGETAGPFPVGLPGISTTPLTLGGSPKPDRGFFKGRIRNLTIDHANGS